MHDAAHVREPELQSMKLEHVEDGRAEARQPPRTDRTPDVLPPKRELRAAADQAASVLVAWSDGAAADLELLDAAISLGLTAQRSGAPMDAFALTVAALWAEHHATCLTARRPDGDKLLTRMAFKSFALGQAGAARQESRRLRHDLRNPLGTIRNSLTLMREELARLTVPETGVERLRAMAARNSTSAEEMLRHRLADSLAELPWIGRREDAMETVNALATRTSGTAASFRVRNELGPSAGVEVDASALELALRVALAACGLADRGLPEVVVSRRDEHARVAVSPVGGGELREHAAALLRQVLACAGGHLLDGPDAGGALVFELPASAGDQRDDLARRCEGPHGNAQAG